MCEVKGFRRAQRRQDTLVKMEQQFLDSANVSQSTSENRVCTQNSYDIYTEDLPGKTTGNPKPTCMWNYFLPNAWECATTSTVSSVHIRDTA